ncbi:hypothetical protein [Flavobacterium sp. N1736]|uniref:hypothetical protein n=1 Tax=Flavobacterium sp. N1736 TaxID=2986823 RepID=UPI0022252C65|nr:hypothetical protein [Flavobacterium sp. N1736]
MKTILNSKLLVIVMLLVLSFSCKTNSATGTTVRTDSDAIKAGDSTSLNSGTRGTTRVNEGNQESDPDSKSDAPTPKK